VKSDGHESAFMALTFADIAEPRPLTLFI